MPSFWVLAALALVGPCAGQVGTVLSPSDDINLPSSESATEPLKWLGANSPYFAGPNVYGISPEVPENCYVDQAAYVTRHGSRYPDTGAYNGWVDMQNRFSAGGYSAKGSLSFLPSWRTVLTNPNLQISMESQTGAKEAYDLGYQLRTRYPQLYDEGDKFMVWSNNYTRVLQTAQMFVRGFLGPFSANGSVISVTSKGFAGSVGNSLGPSDSCPNFVDGNGGTVQPTWDAIWIPKVAARLQALIDGNLTFTTSDISQMPYLCGFESQITGKLSPYCGVFTDEELKYYEYSNDLRYYYGMGPGTGLPSTMMMPFLNSLVGLLQKGPSINGTAADGSSFKLPKLLASFLNDGQLAELVTASGVFDAQSVLSGTEKDDSRLFNAARFVSMRGTIAFERLNCLANSNSSTSAAPTSTSTLSTRTGTTVLTTTTASAGTSITTLTTTTTTTVCRPRPTTTSAPAKNATYVRIKLNDAVYVLPSCKNGPGSSCLLDDYVNYIADKYAAQGNWATNCNVTMPGAPTVVQGASFFTDLTGPWLQSLAP